MAPDSPLWPRADTRRVVLGLDPAGRHACWLALGRFGLAAAFGVLTAVANAESLRCGGQSASEGDSRLSVRFKCGQPLLADAYCAPVFDAMTLQPVPAPFAAVVVPCQRVEEWLYDRGPGNLMATVRFRAGVVRSIRYSRAPQ